MTLQTRGAKGEQALREIVIVGGGAGALELATRLRETRGKRKRARITLVEKSRTRLWKPLLHAIAAGSMDPSEEELNSLAQAHWRHFDYKFGEMIGLDRAANEVRLAATYDEDGQEITPLRSLRYDTLMMAVGSVTNDFGTKASPIMQFRSKRRSRLSGSTGASGANRQRACGRASSHSVLRGCRSGIAETSQPTEALRDQHVGLNRGCVFFHV